MDEIIQYRKEYYIKNKERFREYYLKNKEVLLARSNEWNKKNRDWKEYYKKNREAIIARAKKWNSTHSKLEGKKKRLNQMLKENEEKVKKFKELLQNAEL